ncbi:MAG: cobalamin biosynthesis protein CobD [Candidatus Mycalebacterium zealandia]|nr:MAG: cobalamin biosynthesis protein CobD [Candidatus Mycalebacterium zealandia]
MSFFSSDTAALCLIIGCVADFLFSDPRRIPNPVRLFGAVISRAELFLNRGIAKTVKGAFLALFLVAGVFLIFTQFENAAESAGIFAYVSFTSLFVFFGLAGTSLIRECGAVFSAVEKGDVRLARKRLSNIVGRDTEELCATRIKTAALETMSENLSDGVVAPIFFYFLGGVPAMMAYKAVNTLDSMIGYKNKRYRRFGMVAAKMDDAANFIPARLTAFLMAVCAFSFRSFVFITKFGRNHSSPNAGFPQAALAGILDCRFGGSASYGGEMVEKPFIGERTREITAQDFKTARKVNNAVMVVAVLAVSVLKTVF